MCRGGKPVVDGARDKLSMFCQVNTSWILRMHLMQKFSQCAAVRSDSWCVHFLRHVGCEFFTSVA